MRRILLCHVAQVWAEPDYFMQTVGTPGRLPFLFVTCVCVPCLALSVSLSLSLPGWTNSRGVLMWRQHRGPACIVTEDLDCIGVFLLLLFSMTLGARHLCKSVVFDLFLGYSRSRIHRGRTENKRLHSAKTERRERSYRCLLETESQDEDKESTSLGEGVGSRGEGESHTG